MSTPASTAFAQAELQLRQASALHRQGRRLDALPLFQQALAQWPQASEAWYELGYLLKAEGRYAEAVHAFDQAIVHGVKRAEEVHLNTAVLYADHLRRDDAAQTELEAALQINPAYVPALLNLGNLHEQRGDKPAALARYDHLLSLPTPPDPQHADLRLVALARSAIMRPPSERDDPVLPRLQAAIAAVPHNHTVRAGLQFALGQCYDVLGLYDLAFDAFAKGNRCLLRQSGRSYDRSQSTRLTDAFIQAFASAPESTASTTAKADGATPLFICGMFRSGSTLVEQVLAAHSAVIAGGEVDWLLRVAAERMAPFPASMRHSTAQAEAALAQEYRAHLASLFPQAHTGMYITDKRPDNFQLIGLIKRLFPGAKIVHTTRDPLDNGLSVFIQHLNLQVTGYAADLADIGHYYGEYRRLMAHWKSLYPDDIHDFDYDAFVRDPVPALQALCDFLDLPWDARCLEFHTLRNTVKTASYWQVRRPLYGNASGRWLNYRAHLGPLLQALQQAGIPLAQSAMD